MNSFNQFKTSKIFPVKENNPKAVIKRLEIHISQNPFKG
jgi:hypothetical protein